MLRGDWDIQRALPKHVGPGQVDGHYMLNSLLTSLYNSIHVATLQASNTDPNGPARIVIIRQSLFRLNCSKSFRLERDCL